MTGAHNRSSAPHPQGISRRTFIRLAAMASLLAGCRPMEKLVTPVLSEVGPEPGREVEGLTSTPLPPRSEIIRFYPDVPSKVVYARHAGVWDGETLVPGVIQQMLDASIVALTGLNDARAAWAVLFDPSERIAIKVNTIDASSFWTHVPLVLAVTERLQEVGVPPEQIIIFDRYDYELKNAGYTINRDGPGVRCYGTETDYTTDWTVMDRTVGLSNILLSCDALINMPILKTHSISGFTFAMKNHYGTFDRPRSFHHGIGRAIPELNALPPIRDRTRLIIGDALTVCVRGWHKAVTWGSILMSFDPVAHDTIGLQVIGEVLASEELSPSEATVDRSSAWLSNGAELGLGTNDPDNIELVEVRLG